MASQPLRLQGVPRGLVALLEQKGLTQAGEVVQASTLDLVELLNLSHSVCRGLQEAASRQIAPAPVTAAQLYQAAHAGAHTRVVTGLPALDAALRGGLPSGAITELVGPSGAGKTQLCTTALLHAVAPPPLGLQRRVIYVDTERKFKLSRLQEMAVAWLANAGLLGGEGPSAAAGMHDAAAAGPEAPGQGVPSAVHGAASAGPEVAQAGKDLGTAAPGDVLAALLDRVLITYPNDTEQLMHCLYSLQASVGSQEAVLVVVDSIAALVRTAFDARDARTNLNSRTELLGQAASCLKTLAEEYRIPVLVTNQVSARMTNTAAAHDFQPGALPGPHTGTGDGEGGDSNSASAALGTAWAHSVNVRIMMERVGDNRYLQLIKSPAAASMALEYAIGASGVQQVGVAAPATHMGSVLDARMTGK